MRLWLRGSGGAHSIKPATVTRAHTHARPLRTRKCMQVLEHMRDPARTGKPLLVLPETRKHARARAHTHTKHNPRTHTRTHKQVLPMPAVVFEPNYSLSKATVPRSTKAE
jgi:hypothetical protein